jgi:hypothetical protein
VCRRRNFVYGPPVCKSTRSSNHLRQFCQLTRDVLLLQNQRARDFVSTEYQVGQVGQLGTCFCGQPGRSRVCRLWLRSVISDSATHQVGQHGQRHFLRIHRAILRYIMARRGQRYLCFSPKRTRFAEGDKVFGGCIGEMCDVRCLILNVGN